MDINKEILMTIVRNSGGRLEGDQEVLEINEKQLHLISKKLTKLFSIHGISQQRELLIAYEIWKTENDIKNLLPEQLADFYIESN